MEGNFINLTGINSIFKKSVSLNNNNNNNVNNSSYNLDINYKFTPGFSIHMLSEISVLLFIFRGGFNWDSINSYSKSLSYSTPNDGNCDYINFIYYIFFFKISFLIYHFL